MVQKEDIVIQFTAAIDHKRNQLCIIVGQARGALEGVLDIAPQQAVFTGLYAEKRWKSDYGLVLP